MSLPREFAELERRLSDTGKNPFLPNEVKLLPEIKQLASRVASLSIADPEAIAILCLQALRVQRSELSPRLIEAEFVATLPADIPGLARQTKFVVSDMIHAAKSEVVLLGYDLRDLSLIKNLADAAERGVEILMILDRARGSSQVVLENWPIGTPTPRIFNDAFGELAAKYASLHAKCLLVDGRDLLITSANFTFHGLNGNIEMGIRLVGSSAAEARKIFSYLVESGLVVELLTSE